MAFKNVFNNNYSLIILVSLLYFTACSPTKKISQNTIERNLLNSFYKWQGTPYLLGGTTTAGVDCSAFILMIYRDAFNIQLPRTTSEQLRAGNPVSRRKLKTGDLVFFRTGRDVLHVGIVISGGRMMHASATNGVEITRLNQDYWRRRFIGARRII